EATAISQLIRAARQTPNVAARERAWERALRADPGNAEALLGYCELLVETGRPQAAIALLERALGDTTEPAHVHVALAEAWLAADLPARAVEHLQLAVVLDPDSPQLL